MQLIRHVPWNHDKKGYETMRDRERYRERERERERCDRGREIKCGESEGAARKTNIQNNIMNIEQ